MNYNTTRSRHLNYFSWIRVKLAQFDLKAVTVCAAMRLRTLLVVKLNRFWCVDRSRYVPWRRFRSLSAYSKHTVFDRRRLRMQCMLGNVYTEMHAPTFVLGRSNRFRLTVGRSWRRVSQNSGSGSVARSARLWLTVVPQASRAICLLINGKLSRRYGLIVLPIRPISSLARLVRW